MKIPGKIPLQQESADGGLGHDAVDDKGMLGGMIGPMEDEAAVMAAL